MRILLVDDDHGTLNILVARLMSGGHEAVTRTSGREALQLLKRSANGSSGIDMLVTDYRMPDLNGLELIRQMRHVRREMPAVLVTAFGDAKLREVVCRMKHCAYLDKPFRLEALNEIMETLFDGTNS